MKKLLFILIAANFIGHLYAQDAPVPMNNFSYDASTDQVTYTKIIQADNQSASVIANKLFNKLLTTSQVIKVNYDSDGFDVITGNIQHIYLKDQPKIGDRDNLVGEFKIEVKDGKYRLTITELEWYALFQQVWQESTGQRTYSTYQKRISLADRVMNGKKTKWDDAEAKILPLLDDIFNQKFSMGPVTDKFNMPINTNHNFWIDRSNGTIAYIRVIKDSNIRNNNSVHQLFDRVMKSDEAGDVRLYNEKTISGFITKVNYYYKNSIVGSGAVDGAFSIEVRKGEYCIFIHDLVMSGSGNVFEYGMLNNDGTDWASGTDYLLQELDDTFSQEFTIKSKPPELPKNKTW